jgi:hypothetical protein
VWGILCVSVRSSWPVILFESCISFLLFCLVILSILEHGALKSATVIVELSISPFSSVNVCFRDFGTLMFVVLFVINIIFFG